MGLPSAITATLLSAALLALALPPWSLRPLAFVGLVPLLLALQSGGATRAVALAVGFGVAFGWTTAPTFPASIATYYEQPLWFGVILGSALFAAMASVYYGAFAAILRGLAASAGWTAPLLTAAAWVSIELGRARLFTGTDFFIGNPWALLGYTHASGPLAQVASLTGVYGISFVVVAVNAGLARLLLDRIERRERDTGWAWRAAISCAPAIVVYLAGAYTLATAPEDEAASLVEVGVVQGNLSTGRRWRADAYGRNLERYMGLTRDLLRSGSPDLVVWPENAVSFYVEEERRYLEALAELPKAGGFELLFGGPGRNGDPEAPPFNSIFRIDASGRLAGRYDKSLLMPFSETYPFETASWMRRDLATGQVFSPGPWNPSPLDTPAGRAGILTCNEAMLPEVAIARVRSGAELLISPSNDSWITGLGFSDHMLAVVGLRSIELRRYLIRASTSGPSAVIDPWGRVRVRTESAAPGLLRGVVAPRSEITLYARWGDAFGVACVLSVAGTLLWRARPDRGAHRGSA